MQKAPFLFSLQEHLRMFLQWFLPSLAASSNSCLVQGRCFLPPVSPVSSPGLSLSCRQPSKSAAATPCPSCSCPGAPFVLFKALFFQSSIFARTLRILAGLSNSFLTGNVYMADTAPNHLVASFKQIEVTLIFSSQTFMLDPRQQVGA